MKSVGNLLDTWDVVKDGSAYIVSQVFENPDDVKEEGLKSGKSLRYYSAMVSDDQYRVEGLEEKIGEVLGARIKVNLSDFKLNQSEGNEGSVIHDDVLGGDWVFLVYLGDGDAGLNIYSMAHRTYGDYIRSGKDRSKLGEHTIQTIKGHFNRGVLYSSSEYHQEEGFYSNRLVHRTFMSKVYTWSL